ncbi:MAG: Thivi_2564 family membrane protein [Limisphaerales bacterium]
MVVSLIVVGVLLWLVNTYIPMDGKIKKILNVAVVVVVVLWLLHVFGVLDQLRNVRASIEAPSLGMASSTVVSQPGVASGSVLTTWS